MKQPVFPVLFLGMLVFAQASSFSAQVPAQGVALPAELVEFLNHMEIVQLPDGLGGTVKTIRFHGVNVQIVNGSGSTTGLVDGLGNLIVGYNELRGAGDDRSGSHNLVVGKEHNFNSFGGLVAGFSNTLSGSHASVSGGQQNTASGYSSSVSGGTYNTASGNYSSVSGGRFNNASGNYSSVSGGRFNNASGYFSSVSGGNIRSALNTHDWVAGALFEDN